MRILVTGGAGLVGSHTAEYYAKKGDDVIAVDNLMRSKLFSYDRESVEYNWSYLAEYPNITRIIGDIRNEEDLRKAIGDGVDVVIHTAGQPGVPLSVRIPKEDFSINAFGTLNVLETLRKISPKASFIYCSTNKVYGENVDREELVEQKTRYSFQNIKGIPETLPIDHTGHTPYGASKYVGDLYTQEYAHIYGMKTGVFRMSCIYGTRQFGFEDQGWVAWFVIAALTNQPITIYGNGKQVRDLLYVTDLVEAYDMFIKSDLQHAVFNIGGGPQNTLSLLEFVEHLQKTLPGRSGVSKGVKMRISYSDWRPSDQKVYISDIAKIERLLGWQPKTSIYEGIEKLINWVTENIGLFVNKNR